MDLNIIDAMRGRNGDIANRGYGMMDPNGNVVFQAENEQWGEMFNESLALILRKNITN
ncbi:hypothetical protein [Peribacillus glennii]|uniref:hypothetical protein n=1 Tax=Peribacillus glennii TaxID=2303991 RepID=UPI001313E02B|nr:hypothetical protein [Peribacillus glennii]